MFGTTALESELDDERPSTSWSTPSTVAHRGRKLILGGGPAHDPLVVPASFVAGILILGQGRTARDVEPRIGSRNGATVYATVFFALQYRHRAGALAISLVYVLISKASWPACSKGSRPSASASTRWRSRRRSPHQGVTRASSTPAWRSPSRRWPSPWPRSSPSAASRRTRSARPATDAGPRRPCRGRHRRRPCRSGRQADHSSPTSDPRSPWPARKVPAGRIGGLRAAQQDETSMTGDEWSARSGPTQKPGPGAVGPTRNLATRDLDDRAPWIANPANDH